MKIKWVSMAAAAVIFLSFVLLLVFSHRQDIFTTWTMAPYNTGWTYCYGEESGTATLPGRLDVPKIQKWYWKTGSRRICGMTPGLCSARGCSMSGYMWRIGWSTSSRSRS